MGFERELLVARPHFDPADETRHQRGSCGVTDDGEAGGGPGHDFAPGEAVTLLAFGLGQRSEPSAATVLMDDGVRLVVGRRQLGQHRDRIAIATRATRSRPSTCSPAAHAHHSGRRRQGQREHPNSAGVGCCARDNATVLQARGLSVEVGGRLTLVEASFTVRAGETVGLVGRNGAGKTSMLKVLGGERPAAGGLVHVKGALGYLPQEPRPHGSGVDSTALSHVLSGRGLDDEARRIEKLRIRLEEDPSERNVGRYTRAEESYALAGGYAAESEVRRILAGLGLAADRADLPISVLSGGERRRVELARILFAGSDALILDEPTNHLDVDAKTWLLQYLRSYRGALLVVSHDIELLDEAITRVMHLDEGQIIEYKGTYTQYLEARRKDEERLGKLAERQQAEIQRLAQLADSMRGQTAKRARTAKVFDRRVERLRDTAVTGPKHQRTLSLTFPPPPHAGRTILEAESLSKSYSGPAIFEGVDFAVERSERLLVLGLNGAGKTTLLRILAGLHEPDGGALRFGSGVRTGYYAQEHEGITPGRAVIDHMRAAATVPDQDLRSVLGMFGLSGDIAFQDAGTLSGGEKTKLALAQLVCGGYNLLLLDEPTNNLDPPSRDAVAESLSAWPGTMVVVSHDTEFVESLQPHKVLLLPDGTLDYWDESLLDLVSLA